MSPAPSRRPFLSAAGGTLAALGGLFRPAVANELRRAQKRAILVWMSGGPSQLETWDPKPGGPHGTTATSIRGLHFDEYMPRLASRAHRMAVVRSVQSSHREHLQATTAGMTGAAPGGFPTPPAWLSGCAHELAPADAWPAFVALGGTGPGSGFLGSRFDPLACPGDGKPPSGLPTTEADVETARRRDELRDRLSADFRYGHDPSRAASHDAAFRQVGALLDFRHLFERNRVPAARVARYGDTRLGRDCLLACRLVEHGAPFVLVSCPTLEWDLHAGAKERQRDVTARFDTAVGAMVDDLIARGLWDHTLVVLMGEFGRTPGLTSRDRPGRDHWSDCWSVSFGGAGVRAGTVVGATTSNGRAVSDRPVTVPDLVATFYAALGIDPTRELDVYGRPTRLMERGQGTPIQEVL